MGVKETLTWNEFSYNVQTWAKERGIYDHSTPEAQLLKALSELGEVADAVIKNEHEGLIDGIGDVAVCIINYSNMVDVNVGDYFLNLIEEEDIIEKTNSDIVGVISLAIGMLLSPSPSDNSKETLMYMVDTVLHCLVVLSDFHKINFMDCCSQAWDEIKDRKGRMVEGGAFVKE